ncbi:MAG TPA: hypothetical protein DCP91_03445 [Eggerthellaceae bacterium]|nr:hypothetical protein [Eggerthellaceae bacterium]
MSVLDLMAFDLLLDRDYLESILHNKRGQYRRIRLQNDRVVWQPSATLALMQYWLVDWISEMDKRELPFATAYEPGMGIVVNAKRHIGAKHALAMDIHKFFPSIGAHMLGGYFASTIEESGASAGIEDRDIGLLLDIALFNGGLVMGSPCAPYLANRVMAPVDERIWLEVANTRGLTYTRYSDDLFFSSPEWIEPSIVGEIAILLQECGLQVNSSKTRFMSEGTGINIAGVYVGQKRITLGQKRKRELKERLYQFCTNDNPTPDSARSLLGFLSFCKSVEPSYVGFMLTKYSTYGGDIMLRIKDACS